MDIISESISKDSTPNPQVKASSAIVPNRKPKLLWGISVLTILIVAGGVTRFFSRNQDTQPSIKSLTVPVQTQSLTIVTEASGSIQPIESVNISPKTTGRLAALYVEQGDQVKTGQLLARMDSANLEAELAQTQAELAQAQAEYTRILNGNRNEAIARAKSQVKSAQARVDLAAKRAEKYSFLALEGAVAQLTLDEYINEDRTARANLAEAQEQLKELVTGSRYEDIQQYKARVNAAKAKVQLAKTRLKDAELRAPFDGIVSQKYAVVGSIVTPDVSASTTSSATSSSILSLASDLELNVKVSEASIANIEQKQAVEIVADAYPNQTFQGRVGQIAPEAIIENNVTSFEVKVELITGQNNLRSGMNVDAIFQGKTIVDALTIPTVAITTSQGQIGVNVATVESKSQFKPVTIGLSQDGQTQIIQGLAASDRVFIDSPPEFNQDRKISLP